MAGRSLPSFVDAEARERIAELTGRLYSHERQCDERHKNMREFMAKIERDTEGIHNRLGAIWRWIMSVLVLLIVTILGLLSNIVTRIMLGNIL